MDVQYQVVQSY